MRWIWSWGEFNRQIAVHNADNVRREREARAPRVEEVTSDMDVEDGVESGGEVGVNVEAGNKRKVVRKGRVSTGSCSKGLDAEAIVRAIRQLPDQERERCMNDLRGVEMRC